MKNNKKKLCVFDLDGTLVDSIYDIAYAVNRGLKLMNLPTHKVESYYKFVGNGMQKLCERVLPESEKGRIYELLSLYSEYYIKHCTEHTVPYNGVKKMMKILKENDSVSTAVLSNKPHEQTVLVVEHIFGHDMFDILLGQKEEYPIKPNPTSIKVIMNELGFDISNTMNIGDSDVDVMLGLNAGIPTLGVSWGFRGVEELKLAGATAIANDTNELLNYILK